MSTYQVLASYAIAAAIIIVILWRAIPDIGEERDEEPVYYYQCPNCGIMRRHDEPWFESTGLHRCPRCRGPVRRGRELL